MIVIVFFLFFFVFGLYFVCLFVCWGFGGFGVGFFNFLALVSTV